MTRRHRRRQWPCASLSLVFHSLPSSWSTMASDLDIDPTSEEVLLTFYRRLYPFKQLFKWLNRGPERTEKESRLFPYREFAFTLRNDAYLRYNSYPSDIEMKKHVCLLTPSRFEIGPVYSAQVRLQSFEELDPALTRSIRSPKTRKLCARHTSRLRSAK